ncbi:MAG: HIT domain-containing protein [Chloroflexota bacterium]
MPIVFALVSDCISSHCNWLENKAHPSVSSPYYHPHPMTTCHTCQRLAQRDAGNAPLWDNILRTPYWDVVHSFNSALPGWLVLVLRRHVEAVADLTEEEAGALGILLRQLSIALRETTGCAKTYVIQFAETAEHPHVHVHVVPRMVDLPADYRGVNIFAYLRATADEAVSEAVMNDLARRIRAVFNGL